MRTRLWQRGVLAAMSGATGAVQRLPRPAAMRFGAWLGGVAFRVARRQRRYADRNLRVAMPELASAAERDRFTRAVFCQFGRGVVDFLRGPLFADAEMRRLVACDGGDGGDGGGGWCHVEAALARGRGVIFLTAHLGNWELLARWVAGRLAERGVPLTAVARDPEDPAFAAYVRRLREGAGFAVLNKGESARGLLRVLKRGEAVILLADQNSADVFTPFFGIPAGTAAGPAVLALRTGATIIPAYCFREADDTFRLRFLPPLAAEPTGDRDGDVQRVMAEANRVLEGVIREYPDQWLWLHNRWKSAFEKHHAGVWTAEFDSETARARWAGLPCPTTAGRESERRDGSRQE